MSTIRLNPGSEHMYFDDSSEALTLKNANLLVQQPSDLMWVGKDKQYGSNDKQVFTLGTRVVPTQTFEECVAAGNYLAVGSTFLYQNQGYVVLSRVRPSSSYLPPDNPSLYTPLMGDYSLSVGTGNIAYGTYSSAIGQLNVAGPFCFVCGYNNIATSSSRAGVFGHDNTLYPSANDNLVAGYSHYLGSASNNLVVGKSNNISNSNNLVGGSSNVVSGSYGIVSGYNNKISGTSCFVTGIANFAYSNYQSVEGKYNVSDSSQTYIHIAGNGTSTSARSNAYTLDWSGNAWFAGDVTNGSGDKLSSLSDYQYEVLPSISNPMIHFERIGRICKATIDFKPVTLATYSQTTVATIPEGYWPAVPNRIVLGAINAHDLWMNVSSENGEVQIGSNATAVTNESVWGTVVWIIPPSSE